MNKIITDYKIFNEGKNQRMSEAETWELFQIELAEKACLHTQSLYNEKQAAL